MNANADNFWQYSVAFYREPEIAEACLKLQNQHGFDVNLVLFCVWYGLHRGLLPEPLLQQAFEFSEYWKTLAVQPLRDSRTGMKHEKRLQSLSSAAEVDSLRSSIKGLELEAEKIQQRELQYIADQHPQPAARGDSQADAIQGNLRSLCELTGRDWNPTALQTQLFLDTALNAATT